MSPDAPWDFIVDRGDLRRREVRAAAPVDGLADGEVLLAVDAFALTANNLTYAVTGDRFGYWQLFPADGTWGRIPAWGVATVERSACPDVGVGHRFTGMVPMSSRFVARPRPTRDGFADTAVHRAAVNPVYNRYARVTDPDADLERDAALRPVYILSFVLAHHLRTRAWLGASRLLLTSASSKASLGLAHALRDEDVAVVGLTSARHRDLVASTGWYADVVTYDRVDDLAVGPPSAVIDVSGNADIRAAIGARLGATPADTVHVGQTDWDRTADQVLGNAAGPTAFFAPTAIQQLVAQWGPAAFAERLDDGLHAFTAQTRGWLTVDHRDGRAAVAGAFDDVSSGAVPPNRFVVVRPGS